MGEQKTWLRDLKFDQKKSQRDGKSILRSTSHQSDVSSGSLVHANIASKGENFKESRRAEDTTGRPDNHQVDTSSTSSTDQDMHLSGADGKEDAALEATILKIKASYRKGRRLRELREAITSSDMAKLE